MRDVLEMMNHDYREGGIKKKHYFSNETLKCQQKVTSAQNQTIVSFLKQVGAYPDLIVLNKPD